MTTLVIRFAPEREHDLSFCHCDPNQGPAPVHNATVEELASKAPKTGRIIVLIPSADVLLTQVNLPIRQSQKLAQAVPFALEDQLAEDIERLHFAIGPRAENGSVAVAVVAREKMDAWLTPLHEHGLRPSAVYPDVLCLPLAADGAQWPALVESDGVSVRTGTVTGFGCDHALLGLMLDKASPPPDLVIKSYPTTSSPELPALPARVEAADPAPDGLAHLGRGAVASPPLDLLQGAYAPPDAAGSMWRTWRWTLALAAALLVLAIGLHGFSAWRLQQQTDTLHRRAEQRFRQLFPDIHRIVDMRAQGKHALQVLKRGGQNDSTLLALLASAAPALSQVADLRVTRVTYRQNRLELSLRGSNLQSLEKLRARFSDLPTIALQVLSANADNNGVRIHISVSQNAGGQA